MPPQRAVAIQLATLVYCDFLEQLGSVVKKQTIDFDVHQMSGVGRSKVRNVGGWAVRKVLNRSRKYIFKEMCSQSAVPLWPELKPNR